MITGGTRAFVSGGNRGLGLAIASALLHGRETRTVMGMRDPQSAVEAQRVSANQPGRAMMVAFDHTDQASIERAAEWCGSVLGSLDLLVNCAAVNQAAGWPPEASKGGLAALRREALLEMMAINLVGPVMTCQAFLPLLLRSPSPCVVNISTSRASLFAADAPGSFGYAISKAALNMATRKIAAELRQVGGVVVAVDPGWIRTRMGGPQAVTEPIEAASRLLALLARDGPELTGRFVTVDGEDIPW
jgi:NAD(P)-dependent dehydrogenase (short-subunit alcohol dehydrogenase family)